MTITPIRRVNVDPADVQVNDFAIPRSGYGETRRVLGISPDRETVFLRHDFILEIERPLADFTYIRYQEK